MLLGEKKKKSCCDVNDLEELVPEDMEKYTFPFFFLIIEIIHS